MQLMSFLKYTGTELQIIRGNGDNVEIISNFLSIKPYFLTYHWRRVIEMVLARGHNICFC